MTGDPLHFGFFSRVPSRVGVSEHDALEEFLEVVEACERLGYDAVWIGEEHYEPGVFISGANFVLAMACAARTSRLRIGLAIVAIPLSDPLRIAEAAATVDQLSGGRLEFGAGRSSNIDAYVRSGADYSESRERQFEGIEVILKAWEGSRFSHTGRYYRYNDAVLAPQPFQKPHPPVYIAASSRETYEIAGTAGYHLFVSPRGDLSAARERVDTYREAWRRAGHEGEGKVLGSFLVYVAETMEAAREEPRDGTIALWERQARITAPREGLDEEANRQRTKSSEYLSTVSYEEHLESDVIVHYGTPDVVAEELARMRDELGLSGFLLDMNAYNRLAPEQVISSLSLFAEEVRPRLA